MFNFTNKKAVLTKAQLPLLVLSLAPIYLYGTDLSGFFRVEQTTPVVLPITAQAIFGDKAIKLEESKNILSHKIGLTHRSDIAPDRGMLYETTTPLSFSGKGMEFATDLIFIKGDRVVGLYANIEPCTEKCINYSLPQKYDVVMEVKAGTVDKLGIKNDTQVKIDYTLEK